MTIEPPDAVELCMRERDGVVCLGHVYRPRPDFPYCYKCGGTEPGALYRKQLSTHGLRRWLRARRAPRW